MRITSVELQPADSSEACVLSFRDPGRQNRYNVKGIVGLDADQIISRFYGVSGESSFYNLSLERREIVVSIELNPRYNLDESPASLRDVLYKMIATSRTGVIQLTFKDGENAVAAISGYVSKFEVPHFSKTPEVKLTVKCDEAMLKSVELVDVDVSELDPTLTNISDIVSTAPHGFKFSLGVLSDVASLTIKDSDESTWEFTIVPGGGFDTGDIIHFSSDLNDKYVYLERGVILYGLTEVISPGSYWPIMFPNDNNFVIENPTSFEWLSISYYHAFWGV